MRGGGVEVSGSGGAADLWVGVRRRKFCFDRAPVSMDPVVVRVNTWTLAAD